MGNRGIGQVCAADRVEEVAEEEEPPSSTDDWSTGEWVEAFWAHYTSKEQLDRVRSDMWGGSVVVLLRACVC